MNTVSFVSLSRTRELTTSKPTLSDLYSISCSASSRSSAICCSSRISSEAGSNAATSSAAASISSASASTSSASAAPTPGCCVSSSARISFLSSGLAAACSDVAALRRRGARWSFLSASSTRFSRVVSSRVKKTGSTFFTCWACSARTSCSHCACSSSSWTNSDTCSAVTLRSAVRFKVAFCAESSISANRCTSASRKLASLMRSATCLGVFSSSRCRVRSSAAVAVKPSS
mmetsp:Transcript_14757/g.37548  ORF Transcript_14757/g.37548 Transcript_14757/m.37548 type:complete len:231 (-) Transcript_14757:1896-2588(-)